MLVALLAVFAVSAFAVSAASAAGDEYLWRVKGVQLGTGASKNIVSKNATGTVFSWKFKLGASSFTINCKKQGEEGKGNIKGSKGLETAGTGEATLTFTECELVGAPLCQVTLTPAKVKTEIVEITETEKERGLGRVGELFTPKESNFFYMTSKGTECGFKFTHVGVTGSTVAEVNPQEGEVKVGKLIWKEKVTQYENAKDEQKTAGLGWAGNPAEISAESQVELESKEEFGAFGPAL
jgi:hypothetical protein